MSINKRTAVILSAIGCAAILVSGAIVILAVTLLFLAGSGGSDTSVRGSYPAPTTRYQGLTAAQWNHSLLDADESICFRAATALNHLGDEGTPFLLAGLVHFRQTGQGNHRSICLELLRSSRIDLSDLALIIPSLDDPSIENRRIALRIIAAKGPRAKPYLPALASHLGDQRPHTGPRYRPDRDEPLKRFHNELLSALHYIDPVAYPEVPPDLGPERRPTAGFPGQLPNKK